MLFAARRLVARAPAALRVAPTPVNSASRLFTSSALRFAAGPPVIQGEGAKDGEIPTDEQQATGLERFELLGKLQGVEVFDMEPLQMTHLGTTQNPIKVKSYVSFLRENLHEAGIGHIGSGGALQWDVEGAWMTSRRTATKRVRLYRDINC